MPPSSESGDRVQAGEEQSRQAKPSRSLKLNGPARELRPGVAEAVCAGGGTYPLGARKPGAPARTRGDRHRSRGSRRSRSSTSSLLSPTLPRRPRTFPTWSSRATGWWPGTPAGTSTACWQGQTRISTCMSSRRGARKRKGRCASAIACGSAKPTVNCMSALSVSSPQDNGPICGSTQTQRPK